MSEPKQDVRMDANVETVAAVRRAIKQAWLIDGEKTDLDADRLALAAIGALAQSDAQPVAWRCKARGSVGANDPQDCDYPECGCDEGSELRREAQADHIHYLQRERDRLRNEQPHADALVQSDVESVADIDLAIDKVRLFRLERMNDSAIWIRLYREGGEDKVIWLDSPSAISAIVEDDKVKAALVQSDAEPDPNFPDPNFDPIEAAQVDALSIEEANAQFDVSAGLIEAAEITDDELDAAINATIDYVNNNKHTDYLTMQREGLRAAILSLRARAADRRGPAVSAGLIEAAEWHETQKRKTMNPNRIMVHKLSAEHFRARASDRSGE